jgi:hypothetical protein
VLVRQSDNVTYSEQSVFCSGSDAQVIADVKC